MPNAWMIRAGEGGHLVEKFAKGYVAIGWHELGDLSKTQTADEIRENYFATRLEDKKGAANNAVAMIYKFRHGIKIGDWALTYNREKREYLLGKITSDYLFNPKLVNLEYLTFGMLSGNTTSAATLSSQFPRIRSVARSRSLRSARMCWQTCLTWRTSQSNRFHKRAPSRKKKIGNKSKRILLNRRTNSLRTKL